MPIDREATLKQAEKLLRQGKLDGAIAEYVRLVQEQPRDWNAINALGDLYVRAGDRDRAVAQFVQIGDHLFTEGFFPKAAALYKKALKVKADHEHTLIRLSEIAAQQGLLADARMYLRQLERQRRDHGDNRGALDCVVRLAMLEEADAETRLAGGRAARELGDNTRAVALLKQAAESFTTAGAKERAFEALTEAAELDPSDAALRNQLARESVAAGRLDDVRGLLTRESAGSDPDLLLALGRMELDGGQFDDARGTFTRLMTVAPERGEVLLALASELATAGALDAALVCADVLVDDALLASDWERAIHVLRSLTEHAAHPPALVKLVELAIDAGRDDVVVEAQRSLADAYVAAGRGDEARVIAEDLVTRFPDSDADITRLRQALTLAGVEDIEAIVDRCREPGPGADVLDFDLDDIPDVAPARPPAGNEPAAIEQSAVTLPSSDDVPAELEAVRSADVEATPPSDDALAGAAPSIMLLDVIEEVDLTEALAQLALGGSSRAEEVSPSLDAVAAELEETAQALDELTTWDDAAPVLDPPAPWVEPAPASEPPALSVETTTPLEATAAKDDAVPAVDDPMHAVEAASALDLARQAAEAAMDAAMSPPPSWVEEPSAPPPDLESVFEQFRVRAVAAQGGVDAGEKYEEGVRHLDQGRVDAGVEELEAAAKTPQHRFRASARLGRLYASRGDYVQAVDWLERAAQAPAGSMEEGWAVLYDLANALERLGENGRALAVLMEIEADGAGYRDVRTRIEDLARAQAGRA